MGDLNARIGPSNTQVKTAGRYPYHKETNDNGSRLTDLCEESNMCIATTRKPHPHRHKWSWQHPNGNKAQLDHVILRRKWINSICNCRCYNTVEINSDYRIITATVKFSFRTTKKIPNITMYNHKAITSNELVRNKFQLELFNRFEHLYIDDEDSVQITLYKILNDTASKSLPKREKETKKPWVSTQSSELIEQRRSARKRYQNHRNSENYDTWRNIAELANASLANDKINKIEQMCVKADAASKRNDTKELINIVKKLNRHIPTTSPSSVNKRNGEHATSFTKLLEQWAEYFKELLNCNATNNSDEIPPAEHDLNINAENFTFEEVSKAINSIKTGKSPGNDRSVTAEALKHGGDQLIEYVREIFNIALNHEEAPAQ